MFWNLQRTTLAALLGLALMACQSTKKTAEGKDEAGPDPSAGGNSVSLPFLLSMDFEEASAISAQKQVVAPVAKVAADSIEVLRAGPDGAPRRLRAKGHVFVQLDYDLPARALCQEALIGEHALVLRGKPVLQRGGSTVEGTSDITVFYLDKTRLRAIGPHKVTSVNDMLRSGRTPGAWSGANPLLPSLESTAVPPSLPDDMKRALEAEMALQQSRIGVPPAFPQGEPTLLPKVEEVPDKPVAKSDPAAGAAKKSGAKKGAATGAPKPQEGKGKPAEAGPTKKKA